MGIDLSLIIAIISVAFTVIMTVFTLKRNKSLDDRQDATQTAVVIAKLENIGNDTVEIKKDIREIRDKNEMFSTRLTIVEKDMKTLWSKVDALRKAD